VAKVDLCGVFDPYHSAIAMHTNSLGSGSFSLLPSGELSTFLTNLDEFSPKSRKIIIFILLGKESFFTFFNPKIPFWVVRGAPNPNFAL